MADDKRTVVILSRREVHLLLNAINTADEYLQNQKHNTIGAMIGPTKIDHVREELSEIKTRLRE